MNTVFLSGRLATGVELKEVVGLPPVSVFTLAVPLNEEEADFFRVKWWNAQPDETGESLAQGRRIFVEGVLREDLYVRDGNHHKGVAVVARRVEYL
jgi:single-stranded DNA-binding protein